MITTITKKQQKFFDDLIQKYLNEMRILSIKFNPYLERRGNENK